MSRQQDNPFDDILQPQPRHPRSTFQDDPFGDDDDNLFSSGGTGASGSGNQPGRGSMDQGAGGRHGYALDPFFDEYVVISGLLILGCANATVTTSMDILDPQPLIYRINHHPL